jgi:hypothetical protein
MDSKESLILMLNNENQMLKRENEFLKSELLRVTGGYPTPEGFMMQGKKISDEKLEKEVLELKNENNHLKQAKDTILRQNTNLKNENDLLTAKFNNLENVFIGSNIIRHRDGSVTNDIGEDYNISAVKLFLLRLFSKITNLRKQ